MMWQPTNTPEHDRVRKLNALREAGISAYPNRVKRTHTTDDAIRAYEAASAPLTATTQVAASA